MRAAAAVRLRGSRARHCPGECIFGGRDDVLFGVDQRGRDRAAGALLRHREVIGVAALRAVEIAH